MEWDGPTWKLDNVCPLRAAKHFLSMLQSPDDKWQMADDGGQVADAGCRMPDAECV